MSPPEAPYNARTMRWLLLFGSLGLVWAQTGSTLDTSGNAQLSGTYRFRHLAVTGVNTAGNPTEMTASTGVITFDGRGNYSLAGSYINNQVSNGAPQTLNVPSCANATGSCGRYAIGGHGMGYIRNPIAPGDGTNRIWGSFAQGVFIGSDTENNGMACPARSSQTCLSFDLFIAIPQGTLSSSAAFAGNYQLGLLDFTGANSSAIKNALGLLAADGTGKLGSIAWTGLISNSSATAQTTSGAAYNVNSDSSVTVTLPLPNGASSGAQAFASGTRTLYLSSDQSFVLGFTPQGYDVVFGVRAAAAAFQADFKGLYYTATLEDSPAGSGIDASYGSMSAAGTDAIVHQRVVSNFDYAYDYVSDNTLNLSSSGSAGPDSNGYRYRFAPNGTSYVAIGSTGLFALEVGLQASAPTGSGVYLNPTGVVNAASYAPITASIAPGELLTLYGSGLAPATLIMQGGLPFPTTLGGVQVRINGTLCALYYVSPGQIAAIVPYEVASNTSGLADIQVSNNGTTSNIVQVYVQATAPGIFSQTQNGVGIAAALHASTGALVTPSNPAVANEYLSLFLTGLGAVFPSVSNGALGPAPTFSVANVNSAGNLSVAFNDYTSGNTGVAGTIAYAGLAPGLAGLYQLNVQVPNGFAAGDSVYVQISTPVTSINEVRIPVK